MRLILATIMVCVSFSVHVGASDAKERFVGTWTLERVEALDDAGQWGPSRFGSNPAGMIMYDSAGNVIGQLMKGDRRHFASDRLPEVTAEEAKTALVGCVAYFGTYEVDEEEGTVTHHRKGDLVPNREGVDAKRFFKFHGELLTLTHSSGDFRVTVRRLR